MLWKYERTSYFYLPSDQNCIILLYQPRLLSFAKRNTIFVQNIVIDESNLSNSLRIATFGDGVYVRRQVVEVYPCLHVALYSYNTPGFVRVIGVILTLPTFITKEDCSFRSRLGASAFAGAS